MGYPFHTVSISISCGRCHLVWVPQTTQMSPEIRQNPDGDTEMIVMARTKDLECPACNALDRAIEDYRHYRSERSHF